MAVKKFTCIDGTESSPETFHDYETAESFGKTKVGRLGVYYRDGLKHMFLAYSHLERVFIRIHEVNLKTCCGGSTSAYFRLVFVSGGKEIPGLPSEDREAIDSAFEAIRAAAPQLAFGI